MLSREMFESAIHLSNASDAARTLLEYRQYRTLSDVLHSFCGTAHVKNTLVDGLMNWNPGDNRESVDRKVRNWLNGRAQNLEKQSAFMISRILELPLERTNEFLKMTIGEGIHWRDPEDIIWSYAIVQNLMPERIRSLLQRTEAMRETVKAQAPASYGYTAEIYEKLQPVLYGSEDDLIAFLEAEQAHLGLYHNTAYELFMQYMQLLEKGFSDDDVEALFQEMGAREKRQRALEIADPELYQPEKISTRELLETYLYRSLVPAKERGKPGKVDTITAIRRSVYQSWPDEYSLSKIKNRQMDVSRKALILLFLATNGSASDFAEADEDEELITADDIFLDLYTRLNLMLNSCGFLRLDPRSPFDWMILYCISAGDLWDTDERLKAILATIVSEDNDPAGS